MNFDDYREDVKEKISKIPNFDREAIISLLTSLPYQDDDERTQTLLDINSIIDPAYNEHVLSSKNPVLGFPDEKESEGDFAIGDVCAGDRTMQSFQLTTENLRENIFITARAGHGKTTLIFYFVDSLVHNNISLLFPDWKNDYRTLARMYQDILVIKWTDLKFNPLTNIPYGMDTKVWWRCVLDVLAHSQGLLMATPSYILQMIEELYDEKRGEITFRELGEYLKSQHEDSRKKSEYADVAENRIYSINQSIGRVINVRHGFEVKDLFNRKVIIEMSPLDFSVASFLIQTLIMHEFYRRLHNNIRINRKSTLDGEFTSKFSLIVMDEAHLTQYGGQEKSLVSTELSIPPLTTFFSQSRELLMGTCAATQFPHLVMQAFKDNAGTKIVGNITEADHQKDLASSLGLDRDEQKVLGKLEKGFWITRVSGRTKPFLLKTPEVSKGDLIADADVYQRSKPLLTEFQMKQQEIESKMFLHKVEKSSDKVVIPELTDEAWKVLDYILEHPFKYQKKIANSLKLSGRKMRDARDLLVQKNLIKLEKFAEIKYQNIHYVLTGKALDILKSIGKESKKIGFWKYISSGNPGYWHRNFQFTISGLHSGLGWNCKVEHMLKDGRRVDGYFVKEWRKAIEIENTTKDVEKKIELMKSNEVDELVLLYKDELQLKFAKARLMKMKDIPDKVLWVGLARDYVKLLIGMLNGTIREPETHGKDEKSDDFTPGADAERKHRGNNEEKA